MPLINHDKSISHANTLNRIGKATGIDNFSSSSMLRLISQGLHEDIANFADLVREGINNTFPEFSKGRYLDAEGAQFGVYRNNLKSMTLSADSQSVVIEPRDSAPDFSSYLTNPIDIAPGTILSSSGQIKITLLRSITISPADARTYVTVKIEPISQIAGVQINKGDLFKLLSTSSIGETASYLQLRFNTAVNMKLGTESEEKFRERVIFARDNLNKGTLSAIYNAISLIPSVHGFSVIGNSRGQGTIDIGITTERLEKDQEDPAMRFILQLANQYIMDVVAFGYSVEIFAPTPCYVMLKYTAGNTDISHASIASVASQIFPTLYRYSGNNSVSLNELKRRILSSLPDLMSFEITSASLLDSSINEILVSSTENMTAPIDKFIVLTEGNISAQV